MALSATRIQVQRLSALPGDKLDEHAVIIEMLSRTPPEASPKFLYDALGSEIFEAITEAPEYYPTRAETEILEANAERIMARVRPDEFLELGSGASRKTRLLIEAMEHNGGHRYVPFDVSEQAVRDAADVLCSDYPWLQVHGLVGDFHADIKGVPHEGRRLIAFLGSTIGNLYRPQRASFLSMVRRLLSDQDEFLIGFDLVKATDVLEAAYNDAGGVTKAFTMNALTVLNRRLDANFKPEQFEYRGVWDPAESWIEMRLIAREDVAVRFEKLGLDLVIPSGQHLRTEVSTKFTIEAMTAELAEAGLKPIEWLKDKAGRFCVALARAAQ